MRTIRQQFLLMLVCMDFVVMALFSWVLYAQKKEQLMKDIDNTLRSVAFMARATLPADYHDRIRGPDSVPDGEFQAIVDTYNQLCEALGLEYIWSLMLIDGEIVFTSSTSPDKVAANRKHAMFFERHTNPELYLPVFTSMAPTYKTNHDKWGDIRVALLPWVDSHGRKYLFGASITLEEVDRQLLSIICTSLAAGGVLFLGSLLVGFWATHKVTGPIQRLTTTIQSIADGESDREADERGSYEVRVLAKHFNRLNRALHGKISELEASRLRLLGLREAERKQAAEELFSSEQRYRSILNFAVDGILIGSHDGTIIETNMRMCELFGLSRDEVIGKHVTAMPFTPESIRDRPFRFDLVKRGEMVVNERVIRRRDGSEITVEMHTKMMPDGTYQSIYHDISERRRVEESLAESRRLLDEAQQIARLGGWRYEVTTGKISWTDEVYRIHGIGKDVDINDMQYALSFYEPQCVPTLKAALAKAIGSCEAFDLELAFIRKNGENIWVRVCGRPVIQDGKVVSVTGSIMDVTERRRAQQLLETWTSELEQSVSERTREVKRYAEQLKSLTGRLVRAEEDERQRIADVLHENLQQTLVAARLTLSAAKQSARNTEGREILDRADNMLDQSVRLTRSLIREISVPAVREGDLPAAVRWIAHLMEEKFGLSVDVNTDDGLEPVGARIYLCLYRAVQEILFNAVKHAKVTHAEISIQKAAGDNIRVIVKDSGCGFAVAEGANQGDANGNGIGLFGIRQRVEGLGGSMNIVSALNQGTVITLVLPVRDEK